MAATATNPTDFLTPKPTNTGIIGSAQAGTDPWASTKYNGKDVLTGSGMMDQLTSGVGTYNKATGQNLSAQDYDKMLNPTTYGARWGVPEGEMAAAPVVGAAPPSASADTPDAASYTPSLLGDPAKWGVTKDQTVAGQMEKYADPNNPYTQMWGAQGAMGAAARGFTGNSTIRDTGILNSVMANATPIASADAATQAKAAGYNTDEANQTAIANQNAKNTAGAFNAAQANQMETSKYTADTSAATQLGVTDRNNATALAQSKLSSDTQKYVSDMNASTQLAVTKMSTASQAEISKAHDANSALIQGSTQAQQAYNSYVAAVAQIDQNAALDYNAKVAAINTQTQIFNNAVAGLKAANPGIGDISSPLNLTATTNAADAVGGVDVSQYLNF